MLKKKKKRKLWSERNRASLVLRGKESTFNAGDTGVIPRLERSPGEGNGNPLHYTCLENSMDRGAWPVTIHGVAKSQHDYSNLAYTHT